MHVLDLKFLFFTLTSLKPKIWQLWSVWDISSSFLLYSIAKPIFYNTFQVITLISALISRNAVTLEPSSGLTLAYGNPRVNHEWEFQGLIELDSKVLTQNCIASSLVIAFGSCFSIAIFKSSNSSKVKFTPSSRVHL